MGKTRPCQVQKTGFPKVGRFHERAAERTVIYRFSGGYKHASEHSAGVLQHPLSSAYLEQPPATHDQVDCILHARRPLPVAFPISIPTRDAESVARRRRESDVECPIRLPGPNVLDASVWHRRKTRVVVDPQHVVAGIDECLRESTEPRAEVEDFHVLPGGNALLSGLSLHSASIAPGCLSRCVFGAAVFLRRRPTAAARIDATRSAPNIPRPSTASCAAFLPASAAPLRLIGKPFSNRPLGAVGDSPSQ